MEKRVSQTDESTDVRSSIARLRQILDEPRSPEDKAQLLRTVLDEVPRLRHVRRIRFVLLGRHALQVHARALRAMLDPEPGG